MGKKDKKKKGKKGNDTADEWYHGVLSTAEVRDLWRDDFFPV